MADVKGVVAIIVIIVEWVTRRNCGVAIGIPSIARQGVIDLEEVEILPGPALECHLKGIVRCASTAGKVFEFSKWVEQIATILDIEFASDDCGKFRIGIRLDADN